MAALSEDGCKRFERARLRMVLSIPELKAAQFDEYQAVRRRSTEADCRRTGREPDDFEVRACSSAHSQAALAWPSSTMHPVCRSEMYRALDFMEAGMPLQSVQQRQFLTKPAHSTFY